MLGDRLVADAYSDEKTFDNPTNQNVSFAEVELHFVESVDATALREALRGLSAEVRVTPTADPAATSGKDFRIEFDVPREVQAGMLFPLLQDQLHSLTNADGDPIRLSSPIPESAEIGGRMVGELRNSAVTALFLALFGIVMYIRVRFHEYKYGLAAVAAVVHDVIVTLGAVVVFNAAGIIDCEIDLAMIAAFLTIIGYSLNDTIVVFDRIRENRPRMKGDLAEIINKSINQTLARTLLTSVTTLLSVAILFAFNVGTRNDLEGFAFAVIVGVVVGTYSSMFVASPALLFFEERRMARDAKAETAEAS